MMYKWLDITAKEPAEAAVSVLGIPFDGGTTQEAGAAEAPARIREFAELYMPCATDDWHVFHVLKDNSRKHNNLLIQPAYL